MLSEAAKTTHAEMAAARGNYQALDLHQNSARARDDFIWVIFEGGDEGLLLAQPAEQPDRVQQRLGLQNIQLRQIEREMGDAKTWVAKHRRAISSLRKLLLSLLAAVAVS